MVSLYDVVCLVGVFKFIVLCVINDEYGVKEFIKIKVLKVVE